MDAARVRRPRFVGGFAAVDEPSAPSDTAGDALAGLSSRAALAMIAALPRREAEAVLLRAVVRPGRGGRAARRQRTRLATGQAARRGVRTRPGRGADRRGRGPRRLRGRAHRSVGARRPARRRPRRPDRVSDRGCSPRRRSPSCWRRALPAASRRPPRPRSTTRPAVTAPAAGVPAAGMPTPTADPGPGPAGTGPGGGTAYPRVTPAATPSAAASACAWCAEAAGRTAAAPRPRLPAGRRSADRRPDPGPWSECDRLVPGGGAGRG